MIKIYWNMLNLQTCLILLILIIKRRTFCRKKEIYTLSNEKLNIDRNQVIKLLTTKDLKWAYQKEWRLVGDADFKLKAPKINRIIIGSNVNGNYKNRMIAICRELKIEVELL